MIDADYRRISKRSYRQALPPAAVHTSNVARRLNELEEKIEQLQSTAAVQPPESHLSQSLPGATGESPSSPVSVQHQANTQTNQAAGRSSYSSINGIHDDLEGINHQNNNTPGSDSASATKARSIEHVSVRSQQIDCLFRK